MAFQNVKSILKVGSALSSYKLLLMVGTSSRPQIRGLLLALLKPFVKNGEVEVRYRCYGRYCTAYVRMAELESDFMSLRELAVTDVYDLDLGFRPQLIVDGGGNIGMFTLRAAAAVALTGDSAAMVVCEPVPNNIKQIQKHLAVNQVSSEIMPVCLGGTHGVIDFYVREANQSSFEPGKGYAEKIEIPVALLSDAVAGHLVERILIKLDIEGMEVDALSAYIPNETRAVYVVGELHEIPKNAPLMEALFRAHGWSLEIYEVAKDLGSATFRGCSPAALPLLESFKTPKG